MSWKSRNQYIIIGSSYLNIESLNPIEILLAIRAILRTILSNVAKFLNFSKTKNSSTLPLESAQLTSSLDNMIQTAP